jgi:hypothetical protein
VSVDKSGKNNAAAEVQLFGAPRATQTLDAPSRPDCCNAVVADQDRSMANNSKLAKGESPPRHRSAQS